MDDSISRKMAIDKMQMFIDSLDKEATAYKSLRVAFNRCIIELKRLPSAQPERKKGRWLPDNNCYYETRYICSECKLPFHVETVMMKPSWRFCPNCGARMESESDE